MSNKRELKKLMSKESLADMIDEMRSSEENNRIVASVNLSSWSDEEKMKAIVASRYLNSVGKGENALELSVALKDNFELADDDPEKKVFNVPKYIQDALIWLLK